MGIRFCILIDQFPLARKNVRMHQPVKCCQALGFPEDLGGEALAIDGFIRAEDTFPELPDHIRVGLGAGEQDFVAKLIGLDQVTSQGYQRLADKSLAAGKAAGQTYF
jgi:hypothetical protein